MYRRAIVLVSSLLLLLLSISHGGFPKARASQSFFQASLRFARLQAGQPPGNLLVLFETSSATDVESRLKIALDPAWQAGTHFSTDPNDFQTNVGGLPPSYIPTPIIGGKAIEVLGNTIIFPIGNLAPETKYGLILKDDSGFFSTPGAGSYVHTLSTTTSTATVIDTQQVPTTSIGNDQILVSASVPPLSNSFKIFLEGSEAEQLGQDTVISYKIKFESTLTTATPLTIQARWEKGFLENDESVRVDMLEYVNMSATPAFGTIVPVLDPVHNTITWTIQSLPANTKSEVLFQLRTRSSYTGPRRIRFPVSAQIIHPVLSGVATQTKQYKYAQPQTSSTPTPTPTSTPTTASDSGQLSSTIPLRLSPIRVASISDTEMKLQLSGNKPFKTVLRYGTAPTALTQRIETTLGTEQSMTLERLTPQTRYFVQATSVDERGNRVTTDIHTYKTSITPLASVYVLSDTVVISSRGNVMQTGDEEAETEAIVVLPKESFFEVNLDTFDRSIIKSIEVFVRNTSVLGFTTDASQVDGNAAQNQTMVEISPGRFQARLRAPTEPGTYEVIAKTSDVYGNIKEQKVSELRILPPMKIFAGSKNDPLENARVYIERLDPETNTYEPVPSSSSLLNPAYSAPDGSVQLVLPKGSYKATISALGFMDSIVEFTIGSGKDVIYPEVHLTSQPFNLQTSLWYHLITFADFLDSTRTYIQQISGSIRFFELNAFISVLVLISLTLLSLSSRLHIPIASIVDYFLHHQKISTIKNKVGNTIRGRIFDEETGKELVHSDVFLIDTEKNRVVAHTQTGTQGNFAFTTIPDKGYHIEVMKEGYEPSLYHESDIKALGLGGYLLGLHQNKKGPTLFQKAQNIFRRFLSVCFEVLLVSSFIFELSLGAILGWGKALPFLFFSCLSLLLWLIHLSHFRSEKNVF